MFNHTKTYDSSYSKTYDEGFRKYMLLIYAYVALGLLITGISGFLIASTPIGGLFFHASEYGAITPTTLGSLVSLAPLGISLYFFWGFGSMSLEKAKLLFWIYAASMGMTFSYISFAYTGHSIAKTFFITSSAFASMSLYGYSTKKDLTVMSNLLFAGMFALLAASLLNIILGSSALSFAISIMGILIFLGMIAWDTQKIRYIYSSSPSESIAQRYAIVAAFNLYLNFINLFLYLIRFTGDQKNR